MSYIVSFFAGCWLAKKVPWDKVSKLLTPRMTPEEFAAYRVSSPEAGFLRLVGYFMAAIGAAMGVTLFYVIVTSGL